MSRAGVIAKRELSSYFFSPIAYVAMFLFLFTAGLFFWNDFKPGQPAALRNLFEWMVWLLAIVVPILCMGLLAQEWSSGTIETLMTAPVDEADVIIGKFFGALGFFLVLLAPTLMYVVMLRIYAQPDIGPILSGYLGILLVGALFIAIALFCSSLTKSHVIAAVMAVAILCAVTILPWVVTSFASVPTPLRRVMEQSVFHRYMDFSKGVVDIGNLVFFLAATAVFLFLTVKVLESRRWK